MSEINVEAILAGLRKKTRFIVMLGLLITMMGVTGCMGRKEHMEKEMLAHMYEKYGVEFEVQEFVGRGIDCSYDVWYCTAKGDNPETEQIEVQRWNSGEDEEYHDEYFSRLVRDEVESRVSEAVEKCSDEYKVYMSVGEFAGNEYTSVEQLDEYLQTESGKSGYTIFIYIVDCWNEEDENQKVIENLQAALQDADVGNSYLRIFFVKNADILETLNRENFKASNLLRGEEKIYNCQYSGRIFWEID